MRLRNVPGSRETIAENEYCIPEEDPQAGNWSRIFGNENPIHVEIGMGKGQFLAALAAQNPQINYIGIEKYSSVLIRAVEKQEQNPLPNIRFVRMDAEKINEMFGVNEVSRIYLNFSDPWPKDRHAKRRLTSQVFLSRYEPILAPGGWIEFKTDNQDLFTFSLEEAASARWIILVRTRDLHHDPLLNAGNIMTEYEERFSAQGNPICKMVITRE